LDIKAIHRKTVAFSLSILTLFLIAGVGAAGCVCPESPAISIGLKQVPYNINGNFTTFSGVTYNTTSGEFASTNPGMAYNVSQYDRLFTISDDMSEAPLFFAIDDKHGKHFFSHIKNGNNTTFRSGSIESDNIFSTGMVNSSGGVVTVQTALVVRNGILVPDDSMEFPNLTGNWTTTQKSVYQINNQEGNVFSGKITASGKTTSTPFGGYIDKIDEDGTAEIVILCVKGNFILGDINISTHNITIPYVLYADGRISSSPQTGNLADWVGANISYNVTQEYTTLLNRTGITEDPFDQVWLLSVSDNNTGRYNLTSTSSNTRIFGIAQEDNSFIEYSPDTGLICGFVKGYTKYNFRGNSYFAEASLNNLKHN
jgi:hypothetical protein